MWKVYANANDDYDNNNNGHYGQILIRKAHLSLQLRWAKNDSYTVTLKMMIVLHRRWRTKSWNPIICSQWIAPVSSQSAWLTEQMKIKWVKLTKKIDLGTECSCGAQKGRGHIRPIKLQFIVQQNMGLEADILAWHQKIKTWLTVTKKFSKKTINIINVYWQECAWEISKTN